MASFFHSQYLDTETQTQNGYGVYLSSQSWLVTELGSTLDLSDFEGHIDTALRNWGKVSKTPPSQG